MTSASAFDSLWPAASSDQNAAWRERARSRRRRADIAARSWLRTSSFSVASTSFASLGWRRCRNVWNSWLKASSSGGERGRDGATGAGISPGGSFVDRSLADKAGTSCPIRSTASAKLLSGWRSIASMTTLPWPSSSQRSSFKAASSRLALPSPLDDARERAPERRQVALCQLGARHGQPQGGGLADGDEEPPRVERVHPGHGPAPPRAGALGVLERLVHDPLRDHQGGRQRERLRRPRAGQPRGSLRPLRNQDTAAGDVPLPLVDQGARPHDVPDRGTTVRLDAPRPMGGGLPGGRHPELAAGRGRRDRCPAAAAVHQDALDEPRSQRARAEPRRPEVFRDPRDLKEKVKGPGGCLPVGPMAIPAQRGGDGPDGGGIVDMGIPGGVVGGGISPWLTRDHAR